MGTTEAQRLIAVSLGKIAMSRQQRGGINLHKNLLVASVLHKARTTYMMDNFQVLLANKKAQAEEAAARMAADKTVTKNVDSKQSECIEASSALSRGANACSRVNAEAPQGERPTRNVSNVVGKENVVPVNNAENNSVHEPSSKKWCSRDSKDSGAPIVTGKVPLSAHNGSSDCVTHPCRCAGSKRRRSFVDNESGAEAKKARFEEDYDSSDSENEYECGTKDGPEAMITESPQVTSLVDIFNSGFSGLYKDGAKKQEKGTGQINVYVSADRPMNGHQYVIQDSCASQLKENVTIPTAIALAV